MSLWRQLIRGGRVLKDRAAADRDLGAEVQHFVDEATAANVALGMSPMEARRVALLEVGQPVAVRETVRDAGWESLVSAISTDVRYALRRLRAAPGFTLIAVLTLAVGLGATTAIFSAVNPILFAPLPYPDANRLAIIAETGTNGSRIDGSYGMYRGLLERDRLFAVMAVYKPWQPALTGAGQAERPGGQFVTASFFTVLGVAPALGRDFLPSDDQPNGPHVVILSDALWARRFQRDSTIIGRSLALEGVPFVVIGVMPKGFDNVLAPGADLWSPLQYDMSQGPAWGHHLKTIGRLRPGVTIEQASTSINANGQAVVADLQPETYGRKVQLVAAGLQDEVTRGVRPALLVVVWAVILVLLIACVNVTNLLLARGVQRRGEFAVRAALGATRHRLVRQVLAESLLLAMAGGAIGLAVAVAGARALVALAPPGLPRVGAIGVHGGVFVFGFAITTLVGIVAGLVPALQAARSDPQAALQAGSRRASRGHHRVRRALVVVEVALAFSLLAGTGLLLRSLQRLFAIPTGFESSQVLTMRVHVSGPGLESDSATSRYFARVLDAVRSVPGVAGVALTSQLPLSGDVDQYGVRPDPAPADVRGSTPAYRYAVTAGYFETLHIPLRAGRYIGRSDGPGAPPVAVISESMARVIFPGADPLGQRLKIGNSSPYTVVGVVGDIKQVSLAAPEVEAMYIPSEQTFADHGMSLVIKTAGNASALASAARQAVWSVDKDQPIVRVATMDDLVAATAITRRFLLTLFEAFGLAAVVLAAAGIYGVLSGSVAERTREIGVRSALGASRTSVVTMVVRQGLLLTVAGAGIGLVGTAAASRALVSLLFGVSRLDPVAYLAAVVALLLVAAVACWVPARRAARVDPVTALRVE